MEIATYVQQFTSQVLKDRKQLLDEHKTRLEADLAEAKRDHSAVSAALALKSRNLQPGDIIEMKQYGRIRIEPDSMNGIPVGQPITIDGDLAGRTILLYDIILAYGKKVAP